MTFVFRRRFPPLKGGLAHVGLLWLRSLATTFTNPIAPWKRERLPFVPDLVCWPPRDRQLHFPFSTSPTSHYNTTDTLSCQLLISTLVAEPGSLPGSRSCTRKKTSRAPQPALLRLCFDSPHHDGWISSLFDTRRPGSDKG